MLLNAGEKKRWNILVLCTGNSARSIMAEAILNSVGVGHFNAFSAGSKPVGRVNPLALEQITARGLPLLNYRSKSWDEFAGRGPHLDLVLTVCDNAAGEHCPAFSGEWESVHWGLPDPAAAPEREMRAAFTACFDELTARVRALVALPLHNYARDDILRAMKALAERKLTGEFA